MKQLKTFFTFFLLLLVQAYTVFAQEGSYGPANLDDKIVAASNGFVLASKHPVTNGAMELIKINNSAAQQWRKSYPTGLTNLTNHWRGVSNAMGGFAMATIGQNAPLNRWELCVITTDQLGNQVWLRRWAMPVSGLGTVGEIIWCSDMGYLVTGQAGNGDMFAAKITSAGNLQWFETYSDGFGWTAKDYAGGGFIIAGGLHVWRLAANGALVSEQDITIPDSPSGDPYDYGERERIILLAGSGYAVVGTAISNGATTYSAIYYARFSWNDGQETGHVYDETVFAAQNFTVVWICNGITITPNSVVVAYRRGNQGAPTTGALRGVKVDYNGNLQSNGTFGGTTPVYISDFIRNNLKWAFGGTSLAFNHYAYLRGPASWAAPQPFSGNDQPAAEIPAGYTVTWVKPDGSPSTMPFCATERATMKLVKNIKTPASNPAYAVYPNPASDVLFVGQDFPQGGAIRLIGLDGRTAMQREVGSGENNIRLDVARLEKGIWMLEIRNGQERSTHKVVLN